MKLPIQEFETFTEMIKKAELDDVKVFAEIIDQEIVARNEDIMRSALNIWAKDKSHD